MLLLCKVPQGPQCNSQAADHHCSPSMSPSAEWLKPSDCHESNEKLGERIAFALVDRAYEDSQD